VRTIWSYTPPPGVDFLPTIGLMDIDLARHGVGVDAGWVILTPRFRTSRNLVLLLSADGRSPTLVAKIARRPDRGQTLQSEARALRALESSARSLHGSVPSLIAIHDVAGQTVLVETALDGQLIDRGRIRREPGDWIDRVNAWLLELPAATDTEGWWADLVRDPLAEYVAATGDHPEAAELAGRTMTALEPLRHAEMARVFEHGDVSHPNLLELRGGRIGIVDWEEATPAGLPLHDLCFFLGYVSFSIHNPRTPAEHPAAFDRLISARDGSAASALRRHAAVRGVGAELLGPLILACWARYAAGLAGRVDSASADAAARPDPDASRGWLLVNRYYHLWRYALEQQDRLGQLLR
jgi:hypothetical protein